MPMLPNSRNHEIDSQVMNDQPPVKKRKSGNSPRLESLLGAAGVISMEQRQKAEKPEDHEAFTLGTQAKGSDEEETPADKMMRFFTGKPCKERSKKSKAIKFPLKVGVLCAVLYVSEYQSHKNNDFRDSGRLYYRLLGL